MNDFASIAEVQRHLRHLESVWSIWCLNEDQAWSLSFQKSAAADQARHVKLLAYQVTVIQARRRRLRNLVALMKHSSLN